MSKRRASKAAACPGCSADFDPEIHIPFVGSCGDSICAVCVDEKKIETCLVCSEEMAFASKKKNKLALELLSMMTETDQKDSKRAKLDVEEEVEEEILAPEEPIPPILNPKYRHFLYHIVNQLNPTSFLNLSSTCKYLQDYCFNSDDVDVIHRISQMSVLYGRTKREDEENHKNELMFCLKEEGEMEYEYRYYRTDYSGYRAGFLSSATGREILQKYPFSFRLNEMDFCASAGSNVFCAKLRSFLAEFPIEKIFHVRTYTCIFKELDAFKQFLKDFRVESIEVEHVESDGVDDELVEEGLTYLMQNIKTVKFEGEMDERLVLNATVRQMDLAGTLISMKTFRELIPKLADFTGHMVWMFSPQTSLVFDYETLFGFNVKPFDYKDPLPEDRPLLFIKEDEPRNCWILRKDGAILTCSVDAEVFNIAVCSPDSHEYPRCLRSKDIDYYD